MLGGSLGCRRFPCLLFQTLLALGPTGLPALWLLSLVALALVRAPATVPSLLHGLRWPPGPVSCLATSTQGEHPLGTMGAPRPAFSYTEPPFKLFPGPYYLSTQSQCHLGLVCRRPPANLRQQSSLGEASVLAGLSSTILCWVSPCQLRDQEPLFPHVWRECHSPLPPGPRWSPSDPRSWRLSPPTPWHRPGLTVCWLRFTLLCR